MEPYLPTQLNLRDLHCIQCSPVVVVRVHRLVSELQSAVAMSISNLILSASPCSATASCR